MPPLRDNNNVNPSNDSKDRHLFGLNQKGYSPYQDFSDDYEQRFPEDPVFEEMGPNARVWRTYLAESSTFDENMVGEAREGLDAMLVFAGLFSAVVTTFLVQTSQSLQPEVNYAQISASLLYELVQIQRANFTGSPLDGPASFPSILNSTTTTTTNDTVDIWVNGLWVISLSLSLAVALASVLVKQWLRRYLAIHSGTPRDRSHTRHFRYIGFEKWGVLNIVGSLPVIMHVSLAFFFVGLVLFLAPLQLVLSCIIGALTLIVYALYVLTNILPIFDTQCPYQTPLSDFILTVWISLSAFWHVAVFWMFSNSARSSTLRPSSSTSTMGLNEELSIHALHWLCRVSSSPSVHSIVIQALSGLVGSNGHIVRETFSSAWIVDLYWRLLPQSLRSNVGSVTDCPPGLESKVERIQRAVVISGVERYLPHFIGPPRMDWNGPSKLSLTDSQFQSIATAYAGSVPSTILYPSLRTFILDHHEKKHHPSVWTNIVRNAFYPDVTRILEDPKLFKILFPFLWPSRPSHFIAHRRGADSTDKANKSKGVPMPNNMGAVILEDMQGQFHGWFLEKLSGCQADDSTSENIDPSHRIPLRARALIVIMENLLTHILSGGSALRVSCWEIIGFVLDQFLGDRSKAESDSSDSYQFVGGSQTVDDDDISSFSLLPSEVQERKVVLGFFPEFILHLVQKTDSFGQAIFASNAIFRSQHEKALEHYLWTRPHVQSSDNSLTAHRNTTTVSDPNVKDSFHLIRSSIEGLLQEIPSSASPRKVYGVAFDILALAVKQQCADAFQLVVDYDCLWILWTHEVNTRWRLQSHRSIIRWLILNLSSSNAIKEPIAESCVDYLYSAKTLHLVIISLIFTGEEFKFPYYWDDQYEWNNELLMKFVGLRPDKVLWSQCQHWLRQVSQWTKCGQSEEDFIEEKIGEQWMRMILMNRIDADNDEHVSRLEKAIDCLDYEWWEKWQAKHANALRTTTVAALSLPSIVLQSNYSNESLSYQTDSIHEWGWVNSVFRQLSKQRQRLSDVETGKDLDCS